MKKSKPELSIETVSNFGEVFDSIGDQELIEMALYYPRQLFDLCLFLTLDRQLLLEEIKYRSVAYSDWSSYIKLNKSYDVKR